MIKSKVNAGFALLYAMLVSGLVLSVSMGVFNVVMRHYSLESAARESQHAFYAADTAAECVYYWDARWPDNQRPDINGNFLTNSPFPVTSNDPSGYYYPANLPDGIVNCNGIDLKNDPESKITISPTDPGAATHFATSTFKLMLSNDRSAIVEVGKTDIPSTKFISVSGHNTDINNPKLVERTIYGPFGE
jgi:hypothetical protein